MQPDDHEPALRRAAAFRSATLALVLTLLAPSLAAAAPGDAAAKKKSPPASSILPASLKIYGKAYIHYFFDLSDGADNANGFNLKRVYFRVDWRPLDWLRFHYTLEGGEIRDVSGRFDATTKAFYVEVKDILYTGFKLRFGQLGLPWVPYAEGVWGYRAQSKVLADRWGYLTSTDLGIALAGGLGWLGDWQFDVVNGEGWKKPEGGKYKDFHLRVTLRPLGFMGGWAKGFFLTAFGSEGRYETTKPRVKRRLIGQIGFMDKRLGAFAASVHYALDPADQMVKKHPSLKARAGQESTAIGVGGIARLKLGIFGPIPIIDRFEIVGRVDYLDPDRDIDDNALLLVIAGLDYTWNAHLHTMLAFDWTDYQAGAGKPDAKKLLLVAEARY